MKEKGRVGLLRVADFLVEKHIEPAFKKPLWNIHKLDLYKKNPKLKVTEDPVQLARIKALEQ